MNKKMNKRVAGLFLFLMLLCAGLAPVNAEAASAINNGVYNIVSALNSNMVVDIDGAKTASGTAYCTDELQQQFNFVRVSGSYYKIVDMNSGKVLDVTNGKKASGVRVQIYPYNGTAAQLWQLESAGGGYYYIRNKLGYYLDVCNAGTANGTKVQVYSKNRTAAQKFKLRATTPYVNIPGGTYTLRSALNNSKVVDVSGAGTGNGTQIQIWDANNTNAQIFNITGVMQGYYKISNVISGRVLDVTGGVRGSGVYVQLYDYNGTDAQLWRFYNAGNGYYYLKNKLGYYLDVCSAATANGTRMWVYSGNGSGAQKFRLSAAKIIEPDNNNDNPGSSYDNKVSGFINDRLYKNGAAWESSKRPLKSSYSGTGCCAYAADFVKYVFDTINEQITNIA